jgi:diadenosine tetraphosphate (Ap4A) HIT family hydrolase
LIGRDVRTFVGVHTQVVELGEPQAGEGLLPDVEVALRTLFAENEFPVVVPHGHTTRMHVFTHIRPEYRGQSGMPGNDYADGMIEHDNDVGKLLKALDDNGVADDICNTKDKRSRQT